MLSKITILLAVFALGYWQGCISNECERPHVVETSTKVNRTVEEKPDSLTTTLAIRDSAKTGAKATITSEGNWRFNRTVTTEAGSTITLESEVNPNTKEIKDNISFVAVRPFVIHFTRTFEQLEYATQTIVERVIKDPWYEDPVFVIVGAALGLLLSLFL